MLGGSSKPWTQAAPALPRPLSRRFESSLIRASDSLSRHGALSSPGSVDYLRSPPENEILASCTHPLPLLVRAPAFQFQQTGGQAPPPVQANSQPLLA